MLMLGLAWLLIVLLYARTFTYKQCIDDIVPMSGYLYNVPQASPAPDFYLTRTPAWHRVLAIGCHLLNTWLVYLLLGEKAALLFAVFPVSVNNVAWITGSYYSCTTMLTLGALYFLQHTPWWLGMTAATAMFALALNTTIATIGFPFVFLFGNPLGLVTGLALLGFFMGKRWNVGKSVRAPLHTLPKVTPDVYTLGRFAFSVKLLALYLYTALVPLKLLFFRKFGTRYRVDEAEQKHCDAFNWWFAGSVALILAWIVTGFVTGKLFWSMWFLVLLAPFCQIKMLGQTFAERYVYPASVGLCAILSGLPEPAFWALVGAYVIRSTMFIPTWESNRHILENGVLMEPKEGSNYNNLSDWYLMIERDLTLAGYYAQKTMLVDPIDYKPHVNFATVFRLMGQYELALKQSTIAKEKAEGACSPHIMGIINEQYNFISQEVATGKPAYVNQTQQ